MITAGKIIRLLQKHQVEPVYLLVGRDAYLQDFIIRELQKSFLGNDGSGKLHLSLDDDKEDQFLGELSAYSLFEEKRLIIIRQIRRLTIKGKEELIDYIENPNDSNCLVMIEEESLKKNKFSDKLTSAVTVVDVKPPEGQRFYDSVKYIVAKKNVQIDPDALELLISLHGDTLANMDNELEKLSVQHGPEKPIDVEAIKNCAEFQRESSIEHLQGALCSRQLKSSMQIYRKMVDSGIPSTQISINLAILFQEILWLKMGLSESQSWSIRYKIRKRLSTISKLFTIDEVHQILLSLRKIDILSKTSSLSAVALMEPLIISICRVSND